VALHLLALPLLDDPPAAATVPGAAGQQRVARVRLLGVGEHKPGFTSGKVSPPAPAAEPTAPALEPVLAEAAQAPVDEPFPQAAADGPAQQEPGDGVYLPRSALTRAPQALGVVMLPYPAFDGDEGHYTAQLSLFIDEAGFVQRVEIPAGVLPPALESAVRQTFTGTRFRPGERDGHPVRSRIEIEVSFDSGLPKP